MTGYQDATEETSMDFQYWLDYVADQQRHAPQPHACGNAMCATRVTASLYCSEYCREAVEGSDVEPDVDDAYYD